MGKDEKSADKVSKFTEKRNEKKAIVKAFLATEAGKAIPDESLEAIKYLAGMGARSEGMQVASELRKLLEAGSVSSVTIFEKFEYGRPTMEKKIRDFIKADEANRIWVQFADGKYSIAGRGANAPRNWKGYVPVTTEKL